MRRTLLLCSLLVVSPSLFAQAQTITPTVRYVDNLSRCEGRAPCHATIMEAVDTAVASDTIAVFPGVYQEAVVISSKDNLRLRAAKESFKPVIAAPSETATAVSITASRGVRISGFILEASEGCAVEGFGGASGEAIIEDNLVKSLMRGGNGCQIEGNRFIGGGIEFSKGFTDAISNIVRGNLLIGGGIGFSARHVSGNVVQSNIIDGGSIPCEAALASTWGSDR